MFLLLAGVFFAIFAGNVFFGSVRGASLLGDVGELIILMFAAGFFVIAILQAERHREENKRENTPNR